MGKIRYWATKELYPIGRTDTKTCVSLSVLTTNILAGIYQMRHINMSSIMRTWAMHNITDDILYMSVLEACMTFDSKVTQDKNFTPISPITDLLIQQRLPEMPSTLRCNDYVNIEALRESLRRYFNETE